MKLTIVTSGATLAIGVAGIAGRNNEPAYGLIGIVPLIVTNPDLADDPWGENDNTLGLTPDRLMGDLQTAFQGQEPDCRDHWHHNPSQLPDDIIKELPKTTMVFAKLDILYKTQVEFGRRLKDQGVEVDWLEVDGLHYVKDMDKVTEAGRAVRQYIKRVSLEYAEAAKTTTK